MKDDSAGREGVKQKLDRYEWDFSECPEDEVFQCYLYEYARTSEEFCLHYEILRKKGSSEGFVDFGNGFCLSFNCPEFPSTPWLKIPKSLRKTRVYRPFIFTQRALTPAHPHQPLQFNPDTGEEVLKLEICWLATKGQIAREFEQWVDTMLERRSHQILEAATKRETPASPSGRQQPNKLGKDRLKALTAYRLYASGMSYTEASNLTMTHDPRGDHALYGNAPAWSRAKGTAQEILLTFRPAPKLPNESII